MQTHKGMVVLRYHSYCNFDMKFKGSGVVLAKLIDIMFEGPQKFKKMGIQINVIWHSVTEVILTVMSMLFVTQPL